MESQVDSPQPVRRVAWKPKAARRFPRPPLKAVDINVPVENQAPAAQAPKADGKENVVVKAPLVRRKPVPVLSNVPRLSAVQSVKPAKASDGFPDLNSIDSFPMRDGVVRTQAMPIGSCLSAVTRIRHMDLKQVLGRGSFGKVYLVKGKGDKLLALKVVSKEMLGPRPDMMLLEQDLLKRLSGTRHLLNMVASFHDSQNFYLLTVCSLSGNNIFIYVNSQDFYPGGDLDHHIRRVGALKTAEARFYAAEIVRFSHSYNHLIDIN